MRIAVLATVLLVAGTCGPVRSEAAVERAAAGARLRENGGAE